MALISFYQTDSTEIFKVFWLIWSILGVDGFRNVYMGLFHNILLNVGITILYPVHLTLGLFMLPMQDEIFKNLSMTITCIVCSFKYVCLRWNLDQVREVEELLHQLDRRVQSKNEFNYFTQGPRWYAKFIAKLYFFMYMGANVAGISAVLFASERRLMYPAWFPFDWVSSAPLYWIALTYQFVGVTMQIVQNLVNDATAPVLMCILAGQVRLLAMRVATIGHYSQYTLDENVEELRMCIEDHLKLTRCVLS